ncbi:hypothetical protein MC885_004207, partial [Smutsia gigantea]
GLEAYLRGQGFRSPLILDENQARETEPPCLDHGSTLRPCSLAEAGETSWPWSLIPGSAALALAHALPAEVKGCIKYSLLLTGIVPALSLLHESPQPLRNHWCPTGRMLSGS